MSADPHQVLQNASRVAVVGFSTNPSKAAHYVPVALHERGFTVFPVHPTADEIAGLPVYRTLDDVPQPIDLVIVFRPSPEAADVAEQAVAVNAGGVWLQLGIASADAAQIAAQAGIDYVENRCSMVDAERWDVRHAAA